MDRQIVFSVSFLFNKKAMPSFYFLLLGGGNPCKGIRVHQSTDGINFQDIYEFPGICGSPSADESYYYTDESPGKNKLNFYRL